MTPDTAIKTLTEHADPKVREAGEFLKSSLERKQRIIALIQEASQQLRLDIKYLIFDLEATRRERDEARNRG